MPSLDISTFAVQAVVVHDVPQRGSGQALVLTDEPITLDDDLRGYFAAKVIASLGLRGLDVVADPTADSTVRAAVAAVVIDPTRLVTESRTVARQLDMIQDARNPAGLLAVIHGMLADRSAIAVLKLEREEGLRVRVLRSQGRLTIDMEHLRDLTLTDKTKVFKTAVLTGEQPGEADAVYGRASDDQRSMFEGAGVAAFFLSRFLGCTLAVNPAVATKEFFNATEAFINEAVASPEKRARYYLGLLDTLEDRSLDLRPRAFVERVIDEIDRSALLARLGQSQVAPDVTFAKDLGLIERRLRGFKIVFDSGIVLVGGEEDLRDRIELRENQSDRPGADINDTIRRLQGR